MAEKKTILITGASRGIGFLTAKTLVKAGHYVVAAMRDAKGRNKQNAEQLKGWAQGKTGEIEVVDMDVTDEEAVRSTIQALEQRINIEVLVNNVGVMPVGITEAYTPQAVRECFESNVVSAVNTYRALLPFMRSRQSGLLINLSSTAGRLAIPYFGIYCASKWALEALVESMHYELESFGIESILVEPGGHATDLIKNPPTPDDRICTQDYGESSGNPNKMIAMFEAVFAKGDKITDPQNVADEILNLVAMNSPRPLRTTVGDDMGLAQINKKAAPIQNQLISVLSPTLGTTLKNNTASDTRVYISADVHLKAEHYSDGKAAIEAILEQTLAEEGCHVFSLMESQTDEHTLHLFEVFESESALEAHYQQAYTKEVFRNYDQWLEKPITIRKMKSASPWTSSQF